MEDVVASIRSVTATMAEICAAAREQISVIEHVNQAVLEIEAVTQQNSSMVEEASAISATLSEQVRRLVSVIGIFNSRLRSFSVVAVERNTYGRLRGWSGR